MLTDRKLYLVAALFALPSLAYPYGADTATFAYVGIGWLQGYWPYLDAFDNKPPGIFVVHALLALLFGDAQMPVRVVDIVLVLACGAMGARLLRVPRGGFIALLLASVYFGTLDFWHTAQTELWGASLILAGACTLPASPIAAGALFAAATLMKTPFALVALTVPLWLGHGRQVVRCGAGALCLLLATAVPFYAAGALPALWEATVVHNLGYAGLRAPAAGALRFWAAWPALLLLAPLGLRQPRNLVPVASAVAAVALQGKYFNYHWGLVMPFYALAVAHGCEGLRLGRIIAIAAVLASLAFPPPGDINDDLTYRAHILRLVTGGDDERVYHRAPGRGQRYDYAAHRKIALWLQQRGGGTLCILRSHEPMPYVLANMRCPSRFFTDFHLAAARSERSAAWRAEHMRTLHRDPPTYILTRTGDDDIAKILTGLPYPQRWTFGDYLILGR
jgi:hypothetical protein